MSKKTKRTAKKRAVRLRSISAKRKMRKTREQNARKFKIIEKELSDIKETLSCVWDFLNKINLMISDGNRVVSIKGNALASQAPPSTSQIYAGRG